MNIGTILERARDAARLGEPVIMCADCGAEYDERVVVEHCACGAGHRRIAAPEDVVELALAEVYKAERDARRAEQTLMDDLANLEGVYWGIAEPWSAPVLVGGGAAEDDGEFPRLWRATRPLMSTDAAREREREHGRRQRRDGGAS